jgi:hypothetical protein
VVSVADLYGRILGFIDRPLLFLPCSSSVVLTMLSGPVPDPLLLRKSVAPGIESGSLDLQPESLTTRPQRRSSVQEYICKNSRRVGTTEAARRRKK